MPESDDCNACFLPNFDTAEALAVAAALRGGFLVGSCLAGMMLRSLRANTATQQQHARQQQASTTVVDPKQRYGDDGGGDRERGELLEMM
jgi:hypothetical protein